MLFVNTVLYYTLFASAVLIYGIGINTVAEIGIYRKNEITYFFKVTFSIFSSAVLAWIVTYRILVPLKLVELYPLICFFIYICVDTFLEALIRITIGKSSTDFILAYLILLLSVGESTSILTTMSICAACFIAFAIMIPFCYTFKDRIRNDGYEVKEKYYSLFFIFLGIIVLLISAWDILWITPGVIK